VGLPSQEVKNAVRDRIKGLALKTCGSSDKDELMLQKRKRWLGDDSGPSSEIDERPDERPDEPCEHTLNELESGIRKTTRSLVISF
jgi:hypothetical protein